MTDYSYLIENVTMSITVPSFTDDCNSNKPYTYVAKVNGSTTLPSFITFDNATTTFSIYSDKVSDKGYYLIEINGTTLNNRNVSKTNSTSFVLRLVRPNHGPPTFTIPLTNQ